MCNCVACSLGRGGVGPAAALRDSCVPPAHNTLMMESSDVLNALQGMPDRDCRC